MYTIMEVPVPALYSFVGISYQQDPSTVKTYHIFKAKIELRVKTAVLYLYNVSTCVMVSVCLFLLCDEKNEENFHLK